MPPQTFDLGFSLAPGDPELRIVRELEALASPILEQPVRSALPLVTGATSTAATLVSQAESRAADLTADAQRIRRQLLDLAEAAASDSIAQAMMSAGPLGADAGAIAVAMEGGQPGIPLPGPPGGQPILPPLPAPPPPPPAGQLPPGIIPPPRVFPPVRPPPINGPPGRPGVPPPFQPPIQPPIRPPLPPRPPRPPRVGPPGPACDRAALMAIAEKWARWAENEMDRICGPIGGDLRTPRCCAARRDQGYVHAKAEMLACRGATAAGIEEALQVYLRLTALLCGGDATEPPIPDMGLPSACPPACPTCGEDPCKCVQKIQIVPIDEATQPDSPAPGPPFAVGSEDPFERLDDCAAVRQLIASIQPIISNVLSVWAGLRDADGGPTYSAALNKISLLGIPIGKLLQDFLRGIYDGLDTAARAWLSTSNTVTGQGTSRHLIEGGLSIINSLNGGALRHVLERWRQINNFQDPHIVPGAAEATSAFLAHEISLDQAICWARANGHKQVPWEAVTRSQRSKLSPGEITQLWRRGKIADEGLSLRLRQIGFTEPQDAADFKLLSEQLPFISDIIRMMVRDSDDPAIVNQFKTDDGFAQKFGGQLKLWADQQGFSEQAMRYIWRAHWSIPAPGQLYEIFHRNRKRGDTIANSPLGRDVETALVQQDILPYWIDRLVGISFAVPGRIDIRRAYEVGVFSDAETLAAYRALGYDDPTTDKLLLFTQRLRQRRWNDDRAAREYGTGLANRAESRADLTGRGCPATVADAALDHNFTRLKFASREACKRSLRRRLLSFEIEAPEAIASLTQLGLDPDQSRVIVDGWVCEREFRGKHLSAQQLCGLADDGLITGTDFFDRLRRAGWDALDARSIVAQCQLKVGRRQAREAETAAKQIQREAERGARLAKGRVGAELKRKKALTKAAIRYARDTGMAVDDAVSVIDAQRVRLRAQFRQLTLDEIIETLVRASEEYTHPGPPSLSELVDDFAAGFLDLGEPALSE